jgi:hypothetical protein
MKTRSARDGIVWITPTTASQARAPEGQDPERDRHRDREGQRHADELEVLRCAPQDPGHASHEVGHIGSQITVGYMRRLSCTSNVSISK